MKLKEKVEYLLAKHNLWPKSSLSQNFLIDPRIVSRLVEEVGLGEKEVVVEIGAGTGVLTSVLVERAKKVLAVEVDKDLCRILEDELGGKNNLEIICEDITKLDLDKLVSGENKVKVVGNLPYHIASHLLLHLVRERWWQVAVFTVQREVAERLLSPPGNKTRGALTVIVSYYSDVERIMDIPSQAFYPAPKVTSTVVRMKPKEREFVAKNEDFFVNVVKASFSARRKILLNSLKRGLRLSREIVGEILVKSGVSEKMRAEELEVEDFIKISNQLAIVLKKG